MTPAAPPAPPAAIAASYPAWTTAILNGVGAPLTQGNYDALILWAQSEGVTQHNNPMAVSTAFPGAAECLAQCGGSSPVYAYDTMSDGVAANIAFLNMPNYVGILSALRSGAGAVAVWHAINQSPWCKGCQSGIYPEVMYEGLSNPHQSAVGYLSNQSTGHGAGSGGGPGPTAAPPGLTLSDLNPLNLAKGTVATAEAAITSVPDFLTKISSKALWLRVGMFAIGAALAVVGTILLVESTNEGRTVTKDAAMAAVA